MTVPEDQLTDRESFVGFGIHFIHVGGPDVPTELHQSLDHITRCLFEHCNHRYSDEVDRFEVDVFVDGKITAWGLDGYRDVRFFRKKRYVRGSVYISVKGWQGEPATGLRRRLFRDVAGVASEFIERLRDAGVALDSQSLKEDIEAATKCLTA